MEPIEEDGVSKGGCEVERVKLMFLFKVAEEISSMPHMLVAERQCSCLARFD